MFFYFSLIYVDFSVKVLLHSHLNVFLRSCKWYWIVHLVVHMFIASILLLLLSHSVVSDSVRPRPWDSPGKNTGVGCHFLLQCIKVKSESEVAQSCPTLHDPMDCSLPGSSVHGVF